VGRFSTVLVFTMLVGAGVFLSCYFDPIYNSDTSGNGSREVVIEIENSDSIEVYRITLFGDDLDTISYYEIADGGSLTFILQSGKDRHIIIEGYMDGELRYKKEITADIGDTDTTFSVCLCIVEEQPPDPPEWVEASPLSPTDIKITFSEVNDAKEYSIYCSTSESGTYARITTVTAAACTHSNLTPNTTYYYKVTARNDAGESKYSSVASAKTKQGVIPDAPTNVQVSLLPGNVVRVSWNSADNSTGYYVYRSEDESEEGETIATVDNTLYLDSTVCAAHTYYYGIKAYSASGSSSLSDNPSVEIPEINELPDVPQNLTAGTITDTSITLTWDRVLAASSYKLYRIKGSGTPNECIATVSAMEYVDTGCSPQTMYSYVVSAKNSVGESAKSEKVTATTTAPIPDVPENVSAEALSDASIRISWNEVANAAEYEIFQSLRSGGPFEKVGTTSSSSYVSSGLQPETVYYFTVKAKNSAGSSDYSEEVSAKTFEEINENPDPPTGVAAEALSASEIRVSWKTVTGASSYNAYRSASASGTYTRVGTTADTVYADTGLSDNTTYYYKVTAENTNGESDKSGSVSAKTLIFIAVPTGLTAEAISSTSVFLDWDNVNGATGYKVFRSLSLSGTYTKIGSPSSSEYTDAGLSSNTTYYYKVSAVGASGESGQTGPESVTTPIPVPDTPTGLKATTQSATKITVAFNSVANAAGYKIYWCLSATGTYELLTATGSTTCDHTNLTPDTYYYYKVSAYNDAGESDLSSYVSAKTDQGAVPDAPTGVNAATKSSSEITVSFNDVAGADGYKIYFSLSSSGTYTLVTTTSNTSYDHTGLTPGTTYYYKVKAYNTNGESDYSSVASAKTDDEVTIVPPDGVTATALSSTEIEVSFNAVTGADGYKIYYSLSSSGAYTLVATTGTTSYKHSSLTADTRYYYKVKAYNAGSESDYSSVASAKTDPAQKVAFITTSCNGCQKCMTQFSCKQGAISYSGGKCVVDPNKCNGCGECTTLFSCPRGAIIMKDTFAERMIRRIKELLPGNKNDTK